MGIGLRLDLEALAELRLEECVESVLPSPRRIDRSSHGFFRSRRGVLALESTSVCLRSTPRAPTRVGGFGLSAGDSGCRASRRSVLLCSPRASCAPRDSPDPRTMCGSGYGVARTFKGEERAGAVVARVTLAGEHESIRGASAANEDATVDESFAA